MLTSSAILSNVNLLDAIILDQILAIDYKILNDPIPDHVTSILTMVLQENLISMLCIYLCSLEEKENESKIPLLEKRNIFF